MKKLKKSALGVLTGAAVMAVTAVSALAVSIDLPPEFSDLTWILTKIIELVEGFAKFLSIITFHF